MQWLKSRRLQYLIAGVIVWFVLFALLRIAFVLGFAELDFSSPAVKEHFWKTFFIGLRFDLRLAIILMLPVTLLALLPVFNLSGSRVVRLLSRVYLGFAVALLLLTYIFDYGHYDYLGTRLNATAFRFAGNADISTLMLWQSYPVVWISLGWLLGSALIIWAFIKLEKIIFSRPPQRIPRAQITFAACLVFVLVFLGLLGRVTDINPSNPVPLRWSDAFFSGNSQLGAVGLNPVIFLVDTASMDARPYDEELVREHYPQVAEYLGVQNKDNAGLNFARHYPATAPNLNLTSDRAPNVVFVMLESLGASRVGIYGNPMLPTPNLDRIAREGWFFERFFVPVTGTAKTVWASITGIPDVTRSETASRNPLISHQRTLINAFKNHRKLYMIGGSAGWANVNALIQQSIDEVTLYEEGDWQGPLADVWGISDLQLFKEADEILRAQPKDSPFFAYIQTAGNHRPFTIPEERGDFEVLQVDEEELAQWGFRSAAQFNAVRFLDYSIGEFLKLAEAGGYLNNTVFVFFGDHNNRITRLPHMDPIYEKLGLESNHVPHMIYAPGLLEPKVIESATSLVDMLPTVAGLVGVEYSNYTMGRDIARSDTGEDRSVPLVLREGPFPIIGLVNQNFLIRMNYDGTQASMHGMTSEQPEQDISGQYPEEFEDLSALCRGLYETARYMLYNNEPSS